MNRASKKATKGSIVHPSIERGLSKLGQDIAVARRSRRLSAQDMSDRMGVDRSTLRRLEQGDPGVSLNTLAMALAALGMQDRLENLVDPAGDDIGLLKRQGDLPKRIARPRRRRSDSAGSAPGAPGAPGGADPEGW